MVEEIYRGKCPLCSAPLNTVGDFVQCSAKIHYTATRAGYERAWDNYRSEKTDAIGLLRELTSIGSGKALRGEDRELEQQ
jgi:hypothetical protein